MELEEEVQAVRNTFDAFVSAVMGSDFTSYLKLHYEDVVADDNEDLFVKNSERAKSHEFAFDLEKIDFEGRYATVSFTVPPGDGAEEHKDLAELTLIRDDERWSLYET